MDCEEMMESAMHLEAPRCRPGLIVAADTLSVGTHERTELIDITGRVAERIGRSGVREGLAHLFSVHTTAALVVNEFESALTCDIRGLLERLVDPAGPWRHDRPELSGCDRRNAASHLRALLLGPGIVVPVNAGRPTLGRFQRIVFVELDGPRERTVRLTVLGAEKCS
jgi:secondary thiamine-phosphate synthase enzyme